MKNTNIVKMALGLAFATIATFHVNADDLTPKVESNVSLIKTSFSELLAEFDTDKNGALSKEELSTSDNKSLKMAFQKLDVNKDSLISVDEFSEF